MIMRASNWPSFDINDIKTTPNWSGYLDWVESYLDVIRPVELSLNIIDEEHNMDGQLIKILNKKRDHVR